MPVRDQDAGKRPPKTVPVQATVNFRILRHEQWVVVINNPVMPHRPVNRQRDPGQQQTDEQLTTHLNLNVECRMKNAECKSQSALGASRHCSQLGTGKSPESRHAGLESLRYL